MEVGERLLEEKEENHAEENHAEENLASTVVFWLVSQRWKKIQRTSPNAYQVLLPKPSWEAKEKRRNLEKVQNQKHTEVKILKREKEVNIIIANAGNAWPEGALWELHYFLLFKYNYIFFYVFL